MMANTYAAKKDWLSYIQSFFSNNSYLAKIALIATGAINVFAFAPFNVWPIPFISLSVMLLAVLSSNSSKQAAWYGFYFGLGWFGVGISWVHVAIADFGGLPILFSIVLMLLLSGYLALYPALAAWLTKRFYPAFGIGIFTLAWLITEQLRGVVFTGFPWLSFGYSQINGPLASFGAVIGEVGLQMLLNLIVGFIVISLLTIKNNTKTLTRNGFIILVILLIAFAIKQIHWTADSDKKIDLALVQGNIQQSIKWQPENELPTMMKYLALSEPHMKNADLIIWPEAAIPRLEVVATDFLRDLDRSANQANTAIVTGIVDYQPDTQLAYNNVIVVGKKQPNDEFGHYRYLHNNRYNKHHLLPIGEFVPFESILRHIAPLFNLPMSSFSRGAYRQENLIANGITLSPAICFEIAFPSQIMANLYDTSDIILTVSNDAWFGDSHGPWQHLQIAQMRALEFGKPVVRVTNNGITAVIGRDGKIIAQLPQFQESVLQQTISLTQGETPYRKLGMLSLLLVLLPLLILMIRHYRRLK